MRLAALVLSAALGVVPVMARAELPDPPRYTWGAETRFGDLSVDLGPTNRSEKLRLDGKVIGNLAPGFLITHVLPDPSGEVDWVVLEVIGPKERTYWRFMQVSADGATLSKRFGGWEIRYSQSPEINGGVLGLSLDLVPGTEVIGMTVRWDGKSLSQVEQHLDETGATLPGGGGDARRWIGSDRVTPFLDAGERLRFQTILSRKDLLKLMRDVSGPSIIHAERDGGFVTGGGRAYGEDDTGARWGIRIADGAPFVVFYRPDGREGWHVDVIGMTPDELPQSARDMLKRMGAD